MVRVYVCGAMISKSSAVSIFFQNKQNPTRRDYLSLAMGAAIETDSEIIQ